MLLVTQRKARRTRMRGNQKIVRTYHLPDAFQMAANGRVMRRGIIGKIEHGNVGEEGCDRGLIRFRARRNVDAVEQLCFRDDRDADILHRRSFQALQQFLVRAPDDEGADVRIQHEARHRTLTRAPAPAGRRHPP